VSPATKLNVANLARGVFMPSHVATLLLLAGGFSAFLRVSLPPNSLTDAAALAGLAGLAVMPLALVVLSYALEPLLVDRYAAPTVLGFAPAIAAVIAPLAPFWMVPLSGALMTFGASHLQSLRARYCETDKRTAELIEAIQRHTGESPVFFETLHELSVVSRYTEPRSRRYVGLDFDDDAPDAAEGGRVSTRYQKRMISRYYGSVTLVPWDAVRTMPELYVVPSTARSLDREPVELEKRYPEFAVLPLQGGLYRFVARREVTNPGQDARLATVAGSSPSAALSTSGTVTENARG
jgi:hypothetical protein